MELNFSKQLQTIPSPAYILQESAFLKNLELIEKVQKEAGITILLALKGFAFWRAFHLLKHRIWGVTASGLFEARLGREEVGEHCHVYSPSFKESEILEILNYATSISFNSWSQWERFHGLAHSKGVSPGIRINPAYSPVATELYNPSAPGSRLGIPLEQLPPLPPEKLEGLHIHVFCESRSEDLASLLPILEGKLGHWLPHLKWLNLGGGHLMTHQDYQTQHLVSILQNFRSKYPHLSLILEPGSAFGWQAGFLKSTVVDLVKHGTRNIALLDVSFTAHMPDCLEMPYQPSILGAEKLPQGKLALSSDESNSQNLSQNSFNSSQVDQKKDFTQAEGYTYWMGGNSCLAGDQLGAWKFKQPLQIGDPIIFEDMLHYTTVKTTFFNGVAHPSYGMLKVDGSLEIYRNFGYTEYKNQMC